MSSSSYIFPLDNLFDHHSSSDLCFSQFFEPLQGSLDVDIPHFGTKHDDQPFDSQTQSELNFVKMFENWEYTDESLSDVVLGSSSKTFENDNHFPLSDGRQQEPELFKAGEANINECNSFLRRVCSTGDITNFVPKHFLKSQSSFSYPLPSRMEEEAPKLGRYTPEQRRMSIDKYRAKRSVRNFNKTIKYECRKTLADNRPRIRGRFKRTEDTVDEAPKSSVEDVIWMDRFHAMSGEETVMYREQILNDYGQIQFQYPHSFS